MAINSAPGSDNQIRMPNSQVEEIPAELLTGLSKKQLGLLRITIKEYKEQYPTKRERMARLRFIMATYAGEELSPGDKESFEVLQRVQKYFEWSQ